MSDIASSIAKHALSNLSQIFVGGAVSIVYPTEKKYRVHIVISNTTGKKSLFLHLAKDKERKTKPYEKLSNIKQIISFDLFIDENKCKK